MNVMKLPILLIVLLLSASPALAGKTYRSGVFEGEKYKMTFHRYRDTNHKYDVSVTEPRSIKDEDGFIHPSSFDINCETGRVDSSVVSMGRERNGEWIHPSIDDVVDYYLIEFCTRNGYSGFSHKF